MFKKIRIVLSSLTPVAFLFFLSTTLLHAQQPPNFTNDLISTGWDEIEGFVWDSTGQQYVWEKKGLVSIIDTNGVKLPNPLIDLQHEVGNWRDHGLNGFVLDPDFRTNGYFYLFYTVDRYHLLNWGTPGYDSTANLYFNATIARVTRYQANAATNFTTVVPGSRTILIGSTKKNGVPVLFESHSAGTLLFGVDGSLLISAGDGAYYNDVDSGSFQYSYYAQALADTIITVKENVGSFRSQLINCLNGKILRIDPMTGEGLSSNPWYDPALPKAPRSMVYALGLRNPFRITIRPGTGNTDPTAGFPGVLYIGDVGWDIWEEFDICTEAGQNFGWPLFEGLEPQPGYFASNAQNRDAPNPLFTINGCTQKFFRFKDLLQQETLSNSAAFKNPCDQTQDVPDSIPTFYHRRPVIDWHHGYYTGITRAGIFVGQDASQIAINDPASPIQGDTFPGFASIAGLWYNDVRFPPEYQNTYFHADFVGGWIRNFVIDQNDITSQVKNFAINTGYITFLALNPVTGCINYARYPNEIREICYTANINNLPVARITPDSAYGANPLTVNFTGSQSTDPENLPLTYFWDFGNGTTSTSQNPTKVYTVGGSAPAFYYAKLTVTDNIGQTDTDSILISLNNTPPVVEITSFDDGDLYSMNGFTNLPLQAAVSDAQHGPNQLFYEWTTFLHHNNHVHEEQSDTNKISTTIISPTGCVPGVPYSFEIQLKVTDAAGLSTTVSSFLYPSCDPPVAKFFASDAIICKGETMQFNDNSTNFANAWNWSFPGGVPSTSTLQNPVVTYPVAGNFNVTLIASSSRGSDTLVRTGYAKVKVLPNVNITSSTGLDNFCAAAPYQLNANSTSSNIVTYEWVRHGAPIGTNSPALPLTQGGKYKVKVTDIFGCTKSSQTYEVTKYPRPTVSVTASGPLLICPPNNVTFTAVTSPSNTLQWKKYANDIVGATGTQYTASTTGQYKVEVTSPFNCITTSSKFSVIVNCRLADGNTLAVDEKSEPLLYPNPASDEVNLVFYQEAEDISSVELYDITGRRTVLIEDRLFVEGQHEVSFNVANLVNGIYQVVLKANGRVISLRLVKS